MNATVHSGRELMALLPFRGIANPGVTIQVLTPDKTFEWRQQFKFWCEMCPPGGYPAGYIELDARPRYRRFRLSTGGDPHKLARGEKYELCAIHDIEAHQRHTVYVSKEKAEEQARLRAIEHERVHRQASYRRAAMWLLGEKLATELQKIPSLRKKQQAAPLSWKEEIRRELARGLQS